MQHTLQGANILTVNLLAGEPAAKQASWLPWQKGGKLQQALEASQFPLAAWYPTPGFFSRGD